MEQTVASALSRGVTIGAHPSYPDREGFGRRDVSIISSSRSSRRCEDQISLLIECCCARRSALRYVKPHGALYNRAASDAELAARNRDVHRSARRASSC